MDPEREGPGWVELRALHGPVDRGSGAGVPASHDRPYPERPGRQLLELHLRIPARMVREVLEADELEHDLRRPIDDRRDLDLHGSPLQSRRAPGTPGRVRGRDPVGEP